MLKSDMKNEIWHEMIDVTVCRNMKTKQYGLIVSVANSVAQTLTEDYATLREANRARTRLIKWWTTQFKSHSKALAYCGKLLSQWPEISKKN